MLVKFVHCLYKNSKPWKHLTRFSCIVHRSCTELHATMLLTYCCCIIFSFLSSSVSMLGSIIIPFFRLLVLLTNITVSIVFNVVDLECHWACLYVDAIEQYILFYNIKRWLQPCFNSCLMYIHLSVIRSSVPKLLLDSAFEQKNDIAKAVEEELEKVHLYVWTKNYTASIVEGISISVNHLYYFSLSFDRRCLVMALK